MKRPTTLTVEAIDAPGGNCRVTITVGDRTRTARDPWGFLIAPDYTVIDVIRGGLLPEPVAFAGAALEAVAITAAGIHRGKA